MSAPAVNKSKKVLVLAIIGGVVILAGSILAGVLGGRGGDENCDCIKPSDAGWRAFSITGFVLAFVFFILAIVYLARSKKTRAFLGINR